MPKCKVCGYRLGDGVTKCPMCGASAGSKEAGKTSPELNLPKYSCPACGAMIIGEHRYCNNCGTDLKKATETVLEKQTVQENIDSPTSDLYNKQNKKKSKMQIIGTKIIGLAVCTIIILLLILFTRAHRNKKTTVTTFSPEKKFEYTMVTGIVQPEDLFSTSIKQFRESVITKFAQFATSSSDSITEQEVMAYMAEMASRKTFTEGHNTVPRAFFNGNRRTYLSAPYFGNLVSMDRTLEMKNEQMVSMVNTAITSKNLDIFTINELSDFILREKKKPLITNLLSIVNTPDTPIPTVMQSAGILSTYAKIRVEDKELSEILVGVVQKCLLVIEENCRIEDRWIYVSQNGEDLKPSQTVQVGLALILYGNLSQNSNYLETGKLLISRPIEMNSLTFQECAELYPSLVPENKFYPHTEILGYYDNESIWAWTCASQLTYQINEDGIVDINIQFPVDESHYVIFKGIQNFTRIEIYKQRFRPSKDFEFYKSSGYVYDEISKTLYLKSRHKEETENIRIWCNSTTSFSKN